jgi:hypothetical protein
MRKIRYANGQALNHLEIIEAVGHLFGKDGMNGGLHQHLDQLDAAALCGNIRTPASEPV